MSTEKKTRAKIELRYYNVPRDEYLMILSGENWRRSYGGERSMRHFHNILEVGICREGTGVLLLKEEEVSYRPGYITMLPPDYPHKTISKEGTLNYWEYIFLDVEKLLGSEHEEDSLFYQQFLQMVNQDGICRPTEEIPQVHNLIEEIFWEMNQQEELYKESVKGLALSLVSWMARLNAKTEKKESGGAFKGRWIWEGNSLQKKQFAQIRPALEYIGEHYAESLKVAQIAEICHSSESHFRRLFEENVGMAPVEYLNYVRIRNACDLIRKTEYSMEEIAAKVGFTSISTFARNFKRILGVSAYQWKKQPNHNYALNYSEVDLSVEEGW